ncbi:hypothetical protein GCM10009836_03520 [Pseudonocardia ailaonensis]|uniref:PASTA domain-containing protein n=1 Tax=Pseudonocardia ailaonensis TaxID=367279 RepID=A0ABN2MJ73_9PSEU
MSATMVPALVGLTGPEAVALGLESGVVVVSDIGDPADVSALVVDQEPKAGFDIEPGGRVRVTFGRSGPEDPVDPQPLTPADEAPGEVHPHDKPDALRLVDDREGEPA